VQDHKAARRAPLDDAPSETGTIAKRFESKNVANRQDRRQVETKNANASSRLSTFMLHLIAPLVCLAHPLFHFLAERIRALRKHCDQRPPR
jgi:hypothetical protein